MIKHIFDSTRCTGHGSPPKTNYSDAKASPDVADNRVLSVYDRLAHAMLQLSQMRPQNAVNPPPLDSSKESTDAESIGTPNDYIDTLETSSPNLDDDYETPSKLPKTTDEDVLGKDDKTISSAKNDTLVISVPSFINSIIISKDEKQYKFELD
uniref:Uncharacterized protein n=1 Tax=Ciona savignyi TaxID=51511 RepID=H2ZPJ4_CIOSA